MLWGRSLTNSLERYARSMCSSERTASSWWARSRAISSVAVASGALAGVTHLRVFHRNEPFARYAADQFGRLPRRLLHVLLAHAPGDPDLRLSFASRSTLQILLHGIECLQYPPERHRPLLRIVPIAVQSRLEASRVRDHRRPGLLSHLRQPPPLLARDHAQRFLQGVSQ